MQAQNIQHCRYRPVKQRDFKILRISENNDVNIGTQQMKILLDTWNIEA